MAASAAWQPPSIPSTIGSSFSSWLRPNHDHSHHSRDHSRDHNELGSSQKSAPTAKKTSLPSVGPEKAVAADDELPVPLDLSASSGPVKYAGKFDRLAASAELWLYSQATPYFKGAHVANVANNAHDGSIKALGQMWDEATSSTRSLSSQRAHKETIFPEDRATIATQKHTDGKVASIRWVAVDAPPSAAEDGGATGQSTGWLPWLTQHFSSTSQRPQNCLNVLEIGKPEQAEDSAEEKVVLLHGYGAGTGFFFQNIAALASRPNSRLYAIDWLGMGRSSRPSYHVPSSALKDDLERVKAAESFFVDSLEEWRKKAGVEKMTLVGHSLGGYLSVAFALRHPERVSRLVLVSPAGVGASPEAQAQQSQQGSGTASQQPLSNDVDADATSVRSVDREVLQSQQDTAPHNKQQVRQAVNAVEDSASRKQAGTASATQVKTAPVDPPEKDPPRFSPRARAVFGWLWEKNFSPFDVLRGSQFLGPWLMSRYTQRRFASLPDNELKALHAYCQGVFLAPGSGEYCLPHILKPGAWARIPIVDRIQALPSRLPISFIYGDVDWMDPKAGKDAVRRLKDSGNSLGTCFVVPHSGHHVYLDNPRAFDRLLGRILDGKAEAPSSS
ncbi:unnamed protein product [Parajaminaea phylloscopi]